MRTDAPGKDSRRAATFRRWMMLMMTGWLAVATCPARAAAATATATALFRATGTPAPTVADGSATVPAPTAADGSATVPVPTIADGSATTPAPTVAASIATEPAPSPKPTVDGNAADLSGEYLTPADGEPATFEEQLAATFDAYDTMGAIVCLIENGRIAATYCYGTLDQDGAPVTADALFRVGSISKMVTAMGAMRLVEQGRLTLDGDLSDILGFSLRSPRYPDTPITLRQLMTHTAGIRDSAYYDLALRGETRTLTELLTGDIRSFQFYQSLRPGTASRYSNFGGGLLGCVIEGATGQTVDAYMSEAIFGPLGLTAAYQGALIPDGAAVANLYDMPSRKLVADLREDAPPVLVADVQTDYGWTAGKLAISAPDLAKLIIALSDDGVYENTRVLSADSAILMRTAQNNMGSVTCDSGRGLCVNLVTDTLAEGRTLYGHGGKAYGMLCAAYFDPTDRTGVVMLTNGCNNRLTNHGVGRLSVAVIRLCYEQRLSETHVTQDPWLVDP